MKIEETLEIATRFIIFKLNGASASIQPINASYNDDRGIWIVECLFQKTGMDAWLKAYLEIDDEEGEVLSFNVST